ncbi:MAG TPA: glucosyl-3-phosphoglycerate synthase [Actinobacteria bacterium]|nr:glucosyl-3-phosphoglycerate synthase [Actinomycetota bacterium]
MDEKWFKERTFHHRDYRNIAGLVELKREQNLTISLGFPTLNVEDTLYNILLVAKEELVERFPLLDQIAIIDGHSTDETVNIARELEIEAYFDDEILPSMGSLSGKGEALWKSLDVLHGDIIAWVDSDIENFHPRFVYGLVGPLLTHKEIGYIKGFYQRPLKTKRAIREAGGGRVTELVARPILNLFYPNLAGFIQPLSGEYAGRREILESVPFYTGYAVETALLVEIQRKYGLESMAQVDLERRMHRNQPTKALGRMSFAILQAVFQLLKEDGKIDLSSMPNKVFHMVGFKDGEYAFRERRIEVVKRPPMNTVPDYLEHRRKLKNECL